MNVDEIRSVAKKRPFQIFEIHVDNGDKYLVHHPENIMVTNTLIVTVDKQGKAVLIAPDAISNIITFKRMRN